MGLLKKGQKKKPLRTAGRGATSTVGSALRPQQVLKLAPCTGHCPSGNDIRGWLNVISQREKMGISLEEALDRAWKIEVETNPFPAIMGRVCPHPCESGCNRVEKDGAVAINSVERVIGDWGIERGLELERLQVGGPFEEKIAVIGSGPSGLSLAYQMARRGYPVTVFESLPKAGGMLRYGIPEYRMPRHVIDQEIRKIEQLGVEIRCGQTIGKDLTFEQLLSDYSAIYVAIGAHQGRKLGVPGEDGPGVYTGTEFLRQANMGEPLPVGDKVVVIGGGDTAIDAARVSRRTGRDSAAVARRAGSQVTILYRRTRTEMPAIEREIEEACEENINIEFLAAPAKILRDESGKVVKMLVQRMELGEPDESGRRRPVPIEGDISELEVDTIITAVSQSPECSQLGAFEDRGWLEADEWGRTSTDGIWAGGDNVKLGLATIAIGEGRKAALSMHAALRGEQPVEEKHGPPIGPERIKLDFYDPLVRAERDVASPEDRLAHPLEEIDRGITREQALEEVQRCFSCGMCFGCERCWMYCTPGCFKKLRPDEIGPSHYYKADLSACDGCKKCAEECPCGYLEMV